MPDLVAVVTTYFPPGDAGRQRMDATIRAIRSWQERMVGARLHFVVCDDGSAVSPLEEFSYMMSRITGGTWDNVATNRLGCGASLAAAVKAADDFFPGLPIFYAQDDWELLWPLDVTPALDLIWTGVADIVRLGPTHPGLTGIVERTPVEGAEWCLYYDWDGGGYVVSWRPAIYREAAAFGDLTGLEGLACIEAERIWLERMAIHGLRRDWYRRVYHAPNATLAGPFRHIETVELGEDSPETLTERYSNA